MGVQRSENNLKDRAALWCRPDPGRKGWVKEFFGRSVITERFYIGFMK